MIDPTHSHEWRENSRGGTTLRLHHYDQPGLTCLTVSHDAISMSFWMESDLALDVAAHLEEMHK